MANTSNTDSANADNANAYAPACQSAAAVGVRGEDRGRGVVCLWCGTGDSQRRGEDEREEVERWLTWSR